MPGSENVKPLAHIGGNLESPMTTWRWIT